MYLMTQTLTGAVQFTPVSYKGSSIPPARYHHTATYDAFNDRLIIFGGSTFTRWYGTRSTSFYMCGREDMWAFDIQNQSWQMLKPQTAVCSSSVQKFSSLLLVATVLFLSFLA